MGKLFKVQLYWGSFSTFWGKKCKKRGKGARKRDRVRKGAFLGTNLSLLV